MAIQHEIPALIDTLYKTTVNPSSWSGFMKQLAECFRAESGFIREINHHKQRIGFNYVYGYEQSCINAYQDHYIKVDPFQKMFSNVKDGEMVPQQVAISDRDYKKTEFYNDFTRPYQKTRVVGGPLLKTNSSWVQLALQRNDKQPWFDMVEAKQIEMLVPHLKRVISLNRKLNGFQKNQHLLSESLDKLQHAVFILNSKAQVLGFNRSASQLISDNKMVGIVGGKLFHLSQLQNNRLQLSIYNAINNKVQISLNESIFKATTIDGKKQYTITVSPIVASKYSGGVTDPTGAICIFISEIKPELYINEYLYRELYELTPSEVAVAKALLQGKSLELIASQRKVSISTIRTQLKTLFRKTQTNGQPELIQCLINANMLIKPNDG